LLLRRPGLPYDPEATSPDQTTEFAGVPFYALFALLLLEGLENGTECSLPVPVDNRSNCRARTRQDRRYKDREKSEEKQENKEIKARPRKARANGSGEHWWEQEIDADSLATDAETLMRNIFVRLREFAARSGNLLSSQKDLLAAIQSLLTMTALILAGWWFIHQGMESPRVKIDQLVSQRPFRDSSTLVGLEVRVTNTGNIPLDVLNGEIRVYDVNPGLTNPPDNVLKRDTFDRFRLEPSEMDQPYFWMLSVPRSVRTIKIYTRIPLGDGYVSELRSLVDLGTDQATKAATSVETRSKEKD
jgi:hypothetical protein